MSPRATLLAAVLLLTAAPTLAQWSTDPAINLVLGGGPGEQTVPHATVVPAGPLAGHVYVGWYNNASGNYDVSLQLLTPQGVPLFADNGMIVSDQPQNSWVMDWSLAADADGNAIVSFADIRDGDSNIHVYKVSPAGAQLWGPNGITLSTSSDFKGPPTVTVAGDGDVVVVWMQQGATSAIHMQRLAPDGTLRLEAGGVVVSVAGDTGPAGYVMVPTGATDVILGYVPVYTFMANRQIKAQRFDALGQPVWAAPLMVMDDSTLPMGHYFQMTADRQDGALFCWNVTIGSAFGARVQRVTSAGQELLAHNGVTANASGATGQIEPSAVFNPATGDITLVFIQMNAAQSQRGLNAQRISAAGTRLWGSAGTVLLPQDGDTESLPRLTMVDGAIIGTVLHKPGGGFGTDVVLGYRLADDGSLAWPGGTVLVAATPSAKGSPRLVTSDGTAVAVWRDERAGTPDVIAQNLNPDGTLGQQVVAVGDDPATPPPPFATLAAHPAYPNPFNPSTTIAFDLPRATVLSLRVYDLAGRLVRELVQGDLAAGSHRVVWNGADQQGQRQPSGVYLYRLVTPEGIATRAMTMVQ